MMARRANGAKSISHITGEDRIDRRKNGACSQARCVRRMAVYGRISSAQITAAFGNFAFDEGDVLAFVDENKLIVCSAARREMH